MHPFEKHAARDKKLMRLSREFQRLVKVQARAPLIPLERPYQGGWMKSYVLSETFQNQPEVELLRIILAAVNQTIFSRDQRFLDENGALRTLRPRVIPTREWITLNLPPSHRKYFGYGRWFQENGLRSCSLKLTPITGFRLMKTDWLDEKIQPHFITHQKVDLPWVRSRIEKINQHLTNTQGWHRLDKLHGNRRNSWRNPAAVRERREGDVCRDKLSEMNEG